MKLKHYLIASEHNNYQPWIRTSSALIVFCVAIVAIRILAITQFSYAETTIDPYDLMNKINNQRTQRFIPTLTTNSKLITAANAKAQDMLARSYFSHIDPDGNYVWPRVEAAGYTPFLTLGENLAMDFDNAADVVNAWMNSPTHRENILNDKFQDQGLASKFGTFSPSHNTVTVVSLFGTLQKNSGSEKSIAAPTVQPTIQNPPISKSNLQISQNIQVSTTQLSGHNLINVIVQIAGEPTLVTAELAGQSITLLASKISGQFEGSFTFDQVADLSKQILNLEARDKNGVKATLSYPVSVASAAGSSHDVVATSRPSDAKIIRILRIIFGIFATIYVGFLAIDAIIMHRAKIKREGAYTLPHLLIFSLVSAVTLFSKWF